MQHDRVLSFALLFTVFTAYGVYLSAFESVTRNQCSRAYLGRLGSGGVIASYNYPFDYRDNLTCVHRIYLGSAGANGSQTLCLTFRRFSLENSSPFCSFDYLELGSSPPMKYCGTGLWQYGVEKKGNLFSNIWSPNLCWSVQNSDKFDLVFSSDNSINGTGFYAIYQVHSSSPVQSHLPRGASDQGPCRLTDWTCFNRRCVALRLLCDGQNDCGDWSDESYAHARCRGQNLLACDFSDGSDEDGFCAFDHEGWFRSSQEKRLRGPPFDHTNGSSSGFYIYSEGSSYLISPQLSLSANVTYCLSFWYFIYGASPSTSLSVFISHEQAHSRPEWMHRSGEATLTHAWNLAEVTIESGASLQVIFASLSSNNESGTALDDISVTEGSCSGAADISCNFESGLCGWTSADRLSHISGTLAADHSWKIQSDYEGSSGPKSDHSSVDGSGGYLYAGFLAPVDPSSRAILVSPAISALPDEVLCLRFWFHAGRRVRSTCVLSVMLHHYDDVLSGDIWSQVQSGDNAWKQARIEFEADGPLQVVLLASVTPGKTDTDCEFALDELWIVRGHCTDQDGVVCDAGQYQCSSGHCVASHLVCDNVPNCRDGSDEDWRAGCFSMDESPQPGSTPSMTNVMCSSATSFLCHGSAICIPRAWLCDLFNDCGDMSDEGALAGCPVSDDLLVQNPSTFGVEADFTNNSTALPSNKVISTSAMPGCEFLCADGVCVSLSQKCDGVSDCTNGHDEANCTNVYVPPLTFCQRPSVVCLSENRCLSSEFVCDGKDDCLDASDEAASLCSDNLGYGAVAGIVFGCSFSTLFLLLVALIARRRRRRRKNCTVRQPHRPNRRPAHISTVFSVNNDHHQDGGGGGGVSRRQIDALNAFVARSEDSEERSQRDRDRDNMGYIDDRNRVDASAAAAAAMAAFPSELHPMFADAPPSYNSVLQHRRDDDGLSRGEQRRRALLVRGSSADELEVPAASGDGGSGGGGGGDVEEDGADAGRMQSRNRRSYRSLPPTPARQPLVVSHLQGSDGVHQQQQQQSASSPGHRRSMMLGYGSVSGHDEGRDHVHRDPSGAAVQQRQALRSGGGGSSQLPPGPPQQQSMAMSVPPPPHPPAADVFHQSCSVISPTLSSSQRAASRIRLGTMALHNRPGTGGHGVCSSACAWHPGGPAPDSIVVAPQARRQPHQCYADPGDVEQLGGPEIADPCGAAVDEFVVLADENSHLMTHQPYPPHHHQKPSARIFHQQHGSSSPSSCLSPAVQQNHRGAVGPRDASTRAQTSSRRPHHHQHQHQHHRHSVENAAADRPELVANSVGGGGGSAGAPPPPPFQRRDRFRPVTSDARHHHQHPAGFAAASNHRRSQSSGAFQDSSSASSSAVGSYHLPNCDDRMFSSPTCV